MELPRRSGLGIPGMNGLAIEAATEHVEVLVCGPDGAALAHEIEEVGHGHTRRLTPLVQRALERAGVAPRELSWIAADLGPGSFTGVRVGLATAQALSMVSRSSLSGASSLASLALSSAATKALVVPLVPAGRRDLYAGFFRADTRGGVFLFGAPMVAPAAAILAATDEAFGALGIDTVKFVGPGAFREQETLERAFPGSTRPAWRHDGLSALDLAVAARSGRGPAAGLSRPGVPLRPLYVRSAQAEERVRRRAHVAQATMLRDFMPG